MTDVVTTFGITPSYVELSFSWTPATTYVFNSVNYPAAAHNTLLTFTATTTIDSQGNDFGGPLTIVEYRWDFGDGVFGYGNGATHTYNQPYFNARTALRVTDSKGRFWYCRAQMYLT